MNELALRLMPNRRRLEAPRVRTSGSRLSSADLCRANGWGVGDRLKLVEGLFLPEDEVSFTIEMTAVGEVRILAKPEGDDGSHEGSWPLNVRDWQKLVVYVTQR